MPAPNKYPNLTNAGLGRSPKGKRRRITTQVAPNVAAYLERLGGGPRKIGEAIEQLVMEKLAIGTYMKESAEELKINGAKIGDIISLDNVQYSIEEWDGDEVTLRKLTPSESVKSEYVYCFRQT